MSVVSGDALFSFVIQVPVVEILIKVVIWVERFPQFRTPIITVAEQHDMIVFKVSENYRSRITDDPMGLKGRIDPLRIISPRGWMLRMMKV